MHSSGVWTSTLSRIQWTLLWWEEGMFRDSRRRSRASVKHWLQSELILTKIFPQPTSYLLHFRILNQSDKKQTGITLMMGTHSPIQILQTLIVMCLELGCKPKQAIRDTNVTLVLITIWTYLNKGPELKAWRKKACRMWENSEVYSKIN